MAEMIDKVFSTKLAEQMTGFYGKQKMLQKLNNKLEMNNQNQKIVELDDLIRSYQEKVAESEEGYALLRDCELSGGQNCPLMADAEVLDRMEEILAEAYEVADGQGDYDPWLGSRPHLEWTAERNYQQEAQKQQELLRQQYEDELDEKERQLEAARNEAELSEFNRKKAELEVQEYL